MDQLSLLANIPGLSKHVKAPTVVVSAPVAARPATIPSLPYHILMRSRHGIEYILVKDEAAVLPCQAAYPALPVVGPADIAVLKGFGADEADQAMLVLSEMPGSRLLEIVRLSAGGR